MRFVEDAFDGGRGRNALFPMEYRFEEEAILAPALEVGVDKSKMLP